MNHAGFSWKELHYGRRCPGVRQDEPVFFPGFFQGENQQAQVRAAAPLFKSVLGRANRVVYGCLYQLRTSKGEIQNTDVSDNLASHIDSAFQARLEFGEATLEIAVMVRIEERDADHHALCDEGKSRRVEEEKVHLAIWDRVSRIEVSDRKTLGVHVLSDQVPRSDGKNSRLLLQFEGGDNFLSLFIPVPQGMYVDVNASHVPCDGTDPR